MNYKQSRRYIASKAVFGSVLGLDRIKKLLELLGNPQKKLRVIHIAGTNGKGSTAGFIAEILKQQGYKTGKYISPYVVKFTERIQVDNKYITQKNLAQIITKVKLCAEKLTESPTEFEIITAGAILYFYEQNCDFAVIETGLGGCFDATNVFDAPLVSVITSVSLDHTQVLGDTLDKIAYEKCGIIKQNRTVISAPQSKDAIEVIREQAKQKNSKLILADEQKIIVKQIGFTGVKFAYKGLDYAISLTGRHQVINAVCTLETIEELKNQGVTIQENAVKKGLKEAQNPARLQILSKEPLIILDGAHNSAGIDALIATLKEITSKKPITIMGMLRDKEYQKAIKSIAGYSRCFIAVEVDNPRTLTADELAVLVKDSIAVSDPLQALEYAKSILNDDSFILICGSLYLAETFLHKK